MIKHFIQNDKNSILDRSTFDQFQYGHSIVQYNGQEINLKSFDIALLGWRNDQYSIIKQSLYALSSNFKDGKVIDLGIVKPDLVPLIELVDLLLKNKIFPIIITPKESAIEGQLKAYEQRYELLNMAFINSTIPYSPNKGNALINKILKYHPHLLMHLNCLGYQSYLTDKNTIDFLEDKYFDLHRLGLMQSRLEETEPILRDVNLAAFSIASIRSSDAPANIFRNPNGFLAAEACKIMRYLCMGDQLSSLCIHGFDLSINDMGQTSNMISQLIWFAIEGFFSRTNEFPLQKKELKVFLVDNKAIGHSISFYKSSKSDRWWFEIPKALHPKRKLIACSYQDYQIACEGDLPDRLLNAINRLT